MNSQENSLGYLMADASRLMRRAFQKRLEGTSLTLAQGRALVHVARYEGVRQVDLAELLELQPMTLARLIDQLVNANLVKRRADPKDRRAYLIFLTNEATPVLEEIKRVGREIRDLAFADIEPAEVEQFLGMLNQVREKLNRL